MAKRISYKTKWLEVAARAQKQEERADIAEGQLARWHKAGADHGGKLLQYIELAGPTPIVLNALDYLCSIAFMETTQRFTYPTEGYSQLYTWKGHPLQVKQ